MPEDRRLWDAAIARFPLGEPVRVEWQATVPRSSGLAGSTALLAATLLAVLEARSEAPDLTQEGERVRFAELVRDVERHEAGIACGFQDAYMVVHGGLNRLDFAGKNPADQAMRLPGPEGRVDPLRWSGPLPFLLITTGVERLSGSVHGPMVDRWLAGEDFIRDSVKRVAELGKSGAQALADGDLNLLSELMHENQKITASLGGSGEAIDTLVQACEAEGALAAKLAGAGMGGTVIALTTNPTELEVRLRTLGYSRFNHPGLEPGVRLEPFAG